MLARDLLIVGLLGTALLLLNACPSEPVGDDDDDDSPSDDDDDSWSGDGIATFSAIADVPYSVGEEEWLEGHMDEHNALDLAPWMIHLGDIKPGISACAEPVYAQVAAILLRLDRPMYIVPGDNEWNDCPDPDEAWGLWWDQFGYFEEKFTYAPPMTVHDEDRPENFAFVDDGVLFVGINLVGGTVHDQDEWDQRFADDLAWWQAQIDAHGDDVGAAVLLGHAMLQPSTIAFFDAWWPTAAAFEKPVLYLHGDGHVWVDDQPWPDAPNVRRIMLEANAADPVVFTVDPSADEVFTFERNPFGG